MITRGAVEQGQTTEFFDRWRCEACIEHDRKCWIRESLAGCLFCDNTGDDCFFTRMVPRRAPRSDFSWPELTEIEPQVTSSSRPE